MIVTNSFATFFNLINMQKRTFLGHLRGQKRKNIKNLAIEDDQIERFSLGTRLKFRDFDLSMIILTFKPKITSYLDLFQLIILIQG